MKDPRVKIKEWLDGWLRAAKGPVPAVFSIRESEVAELACRRCGASLVQLTLINTGGGPYLACPKCDARHYLKGR